MTDRLINPTDIVRANAQRRAGISDARDDALERIRALRYDDESPLDGIVIGWQMANQGADQTVSSTSFTQITGSVFELSFPGADDAVWLVQMAYRAIVSSTGATDTDVYARFRIDWGDGTFRDPDIDVTTVHGSVNAFGPVDYAESSATGVAFSLKPTIALKARGGSTIRVGLYMKVGASQTAVVQANTTELNPHCSGTATSYRRPR